MIDLYYWPTPNGWKISIMLEEVGLPYKLVPVDIGRGDQFKPEFLAISPNNRMPAIVDHDPKDAKDNAAPLAIFESGAILEYLADKSGKLLSTELRGRFDALQWLYWQVGGIGPMTGQYGHFRSYAKDKIVYAIQRYEDEVHRLWGVLDARLNGRSFIAGDYSIADIAVWCWVAGGVKQNLFEGEFPNVRRWVDEVGARPAVQRGRAVGEGLARSTPIDDEARKHLFGQRARK